MPERPALQPGGNLPRFRHRLLLCGPLLATPSPLLLEVGQFFTEILDGTDRIRHLAGPRWRRRPIHFLDDTRRLVDAGASWHNADCPPRSRCRIRRPRRAPGAAQIAAASSRGCSVLPGSRRRSPRPPGVLRPRPVPRQVVPAWRRRRFRFGLHRSKCRVFGSVISLGSSTLPRSFFRFSQPTHSFATLRLYSAILASKSQPAGDGVRLGSGLPAASASSSSHGPQAPLDEPERQGDAELHPSLAVPSRRTNPSTAPERQRQECAAN